MTRVIPRPPKRPKGSQKWLQCAVNPNSSYLDSLLLPKLASARTITWRSPLREDDYAEYSDADFLKRVGEERLISKLEKFWPKGGPQWDGLARCDDSVLLVEAKSHISELSSTPCQAKAPKSIKMIEDAFDQTAGYLGAERFAPWTHNFYQLANRIAHLYFLQKNGVDAYLVLVNFLGDLEMVGPSSEEEWNTAYGDALHALGLPKRHEHSAHVLHLYPDVRRIHDLR
jgi:hypothetical protein